VINNVPPSGAGYFALPQSREAPMRDPRKLAQGVCREARRRHKGAKLNEYKDKMQRNYLLNGRWSEYNDQFYNELRKCQHGRKTAPCRRGPR
jgi:hypothetical protein